ncbi:MAG: hypothetical protein ACOCUR_01140 [Nanoarchaeota archaeon]
MVEDSIDQIVDENEEVSFIESEKLYPFSSPINVMSAGREFIDGVFYEKLSECFIDGGDFVKVNKASLSIYGSPLVVSGPTNYQDDTVSYIAMPNKIIPENVMDTILTSVYAELDYDLSVAKCCTDLKGRAVRALYFLPNDKDTEELCESYMYQYLESIEEFSRVVRRNTDREEIIRDMPYEIDE